MQDRNFDDLAEKFEQNIYGTLKGQIRQRIVRDELEAILPTLPSKSLNILDAGGGIGQIASLLANQGHQVTLCDLSAEMLRRAERYAIEQHAYDKIRFLHVDIRDIASYLDQPVDLILFHAVLEWVSEPELILQKLYQLLLPGGVMSLMFYNVHGLTLQNLTLGNFAYLRTQMKKRKKRTLSPDYPRDPAQVYQWLEQTGFRIESKVGIRVFSDLLRDMPVSANGEQGILEMEKKFSRQEPFLSLGRYIHVTARKPAQKDGL